MERLNRWFEWLCVLRANDSNMGGKSLLDIFAFINASVIWKNIMSEIITYFHNLVSFRQLGVKQATWLRHAVLQELIYEVHIWKFCFDQKIFFWFSKKMILQFIKFFVSTKSHYEGMWCKGERHGWGRMRDGVTVLNIHCSLQCLSDIEALM